MLIDVQVIGLEFIVGAVDIPLELELYFTWDFNARAGFMDDVGVGYYYNY